MTVRLNPAQVASWALVVGYLVVTALFVSAVGWQFVQHGSVAWWWALVGIANSWLSVPLGKLAGARWFA